MDSGDEFPEPGSEFSGGSAMGRRDARTSLPWRVALLALNAALLVVFVTVFATATALPGRASPAVPSSSPTPIIGAPIITVPAENTLPVPTATPKRHGGGGSGSSNPPTPTKAPVRPPAPTATPTPIVVNSTATPTPRTGGG